MTIKSNPATGLKHDPELPFAVRVRFSEELLGRFSDLQDAEQIAGSVYGGYDTEVIDTTPKPKIPEDAEFIIWPTKDGIGPEFAALNQDGLWQWDGDRFAQSQMIRYIGDSEVTVLVRKEEP